MQQKWRTGPASSLAIHVYQWYAASRLSHAFEEWFGSVPRIGLAAEHGSCTFHSLHACWLFPAGLRAFLRKRTDKDSR
eukprot:487504-Amphidinium_carterae.1